MPKGMKKASILALLIGVVIAIDVGAYLVFMAWWLELEWVIGKRICRLKASNWAAILGVLLALTTLVSPTRTSTSPRRGLPPTGPKASSPSLDTSLPEKSGDRDQTPRREASDGRR